MPSMAPARPQHSSVISLVIACDGDRLDVWARSWPQLAPSRQSDWEYLGRLRPVALSYLLRRRYGLGWRHARTVTLAARLGCHSIEMVTP